MNEQIARTASNSPLVRATASIAGALLGILAMALIAFAIGALTGAVNPHSGASPSLVLTFAWAAVVLVPLGGAVLGFAVARAWLRRR